MYYVSKKLEIAGCHHLNLDYDSKCKNLHGHNWWITIFCKAEKLNHNGMVADFAIIKKTINDKLDHANLNEVFDFNPTAENIAKWICDTCDSLCKTTPSGVISNNGGMCYKVVVQESEGNIATYCVDEECV